MAAMADARHARALSSPRRRTRREGAGASAPPRAPPPPAGSKHAPRSPVLRPACRREGAGASRGPSCSPSSSSLAPATVSTARAGLVLLFLPAPSRRRSLPWRPSARPSPPSLPIRRAGGRGLLELRRGRGGARPGSAPVPGSLLSPSLPPLSLRPAPAGLSPSAAPPRGAPWPEQAGAADARARKAGAPAKARAHRRGRRGGGGGRAELRPRGHGAELVRLGGAERGGKDERARARQFPERTVPRHGWRAGARSPFWRAA